MLVVIFWHNFILFIDESNQANILLFNLKEVIDKLQAERNYFKTQVEKLQFEKKQLIISNKNLSNKVDCLEKIWKQNSFCKLKIFQFSI